MTILIGLLGPAGSGKSTVSEYLVKHYGAERYSLAGPLKEIAKNTFDFSYEQLYGTQEQKEAIDPRYNFSPRWLLQRLGTEGLRNVFGKDVWIDLLLKRIQEEKPNLAVCDDVRFYNESKRLRYCVTEYNETACNLGRGLVWRLECPWRISKADATHASEAEWSKCEYDYLLSPSQYGVHHLLKLVDEACKHYNIPKLDNREPENV